MVLFLNALSDNPFYNQHYSDVQQNWRSKLGVHGLQVINEVCRTMSMSGLCAELSLYNVRTLDHITSVLEDVPTISNGENLVAGNKELLSECFHLLKQAGLPAAWNQRVQPQLQDIAEQYQLVMTAAYPLSRIDEALTSFLGSKQPLCSTVYLAAYIKPIAFQLPNGAMVMHAGPHGYMHLPKHMAQLCLHESLHGFPGSAQAQQLQDELRTSNREFAKQYEDLVTIYHSGPEEYFVVGAEAYLSVQLRLRTHEACIQYLNSLNGGMPLSRAIYQRLLETNPDSQPKWDGYGQWLKKELLGVGKEWLNHN